MRIASLKAWGSKHREPARLISLGVVVWQFSSFIFMSFCFVLSLKTWNWHMCDHNICWKTACIGAMTRIKRACHRKGVMTCRAMVFLAFCFLSFGRPLSLSFFYSLSLSLSPRATSTATPCYASARAAARNSEPGDEVRVLGDERRIIHEFLQAACCISGDASIA